MSDYITYRGHCKELAEAEVKHDPSLRIVRGWYFCPVWGKQAHWWCEKSDGTVIDPSVKQFPTKGLGAIYEEYDGNIECEYCGKNTAENDAYFYGHHAYCSYQCFGHDIGF